MCKNLHLKDLIVTAAAAAAVCKCSMHSLSKNIDVDELTHTRQWVRKRIQKKLDNIQDCWSTHTHASTTTTTTMIYKKTHKFFV